MNTKSSPLGDPLHILHTYLEVQVFQREFGVANLNLAYTVRFVSYSFCLTYICTRSYIISCAVCNCYCLLFANKVCLLYLHL